MSIINPFSLWFLSLSMELFLLCLYVTFSWVLHMGILITSWELFILHCWVCRFCWCYLRFDLNLSKCSLTCFLPSSVCSKWDKMCPHSWRPPPLQCQWLFLWDFCRLSTLNSGNPNHPYLSENSSVLHLRAACLLFAQPHGFLLYAYGFQQLAKNQGAP